MRGSSSNYRLLKDVSGTAVREEKKPTHQQRAVIHTQDGGGSSQGGVGGEGTRVKMEAAHPGEASVGKEHAASGRGVEGERN